MEDSSDTQEKENPNLEFFEKAERAFKQLFDAARAKNELEFAFALEPEERGYRNSGWSSAAETFIAFDDYLEFLHSGENTRFKFRVALSFYCHLAEASSFYEVPNKIRVIQMTEFDQIFNKGLGFFQVLRNVLKEYMRSYLPAKIIIGKLHDEPEGPCKIEFLPEYRAFVISRGDDYWRWVIDAREIFADENPEAHDTP